MTARKGQRDGYSMGGLSFGGEKARSIAAGVRATRNANAERVRCPRCELLITPHNLPRHIALVHEEN